MAFPWTDHAAISSVLNRLSKAAEVKARYCHVQLAGGYYLKYSTLHTCFKPPEIEKEAQTDDMDYTAPN